MADTVFGAAVGNETAIPMSLAMPEKRGLLAEAAIHAAVAPDDIAQ